MWVSSSGQMKPFQLTRQFCLDTFTPTDDFVCLLRDPSICSQTEYNLIKYYVKLMKYENKGEKIGVVIFIKIKRFRKAKERWVTKELLLNWEQMKKKVKFWEIVIKEIPFSRPTLEKKKTLNLHKSVIKNKTLELNICHFYDPLHQFTFSIEFCKLHCVIRSLLTLPSFWVLQTLSEPSVEYCRSSAIVHWFDQ